MVCDLEEGSISYIFEDHAPGERISIRDVYNMKHTQDIVKSKQVMYHKTKGFIVTESHQ